jgi:lysophospholipase L1-like esterase
MRRNGLGQHRFDLSHLILCHCWSRPPNPEDRSIARYYAPLTPTREKHRVTLNTWIRESGAFDGVADFDAAVRDPERPTQMAARWDCGDGLHQSDSGYCHMADAIDLSLLD